MTADGTAHDALDRIARGVRAISLLCGYVAAGLVAFAVVIVCHMVIVRYVLNQSTIWQTDLITYCITAATFIGCPYVLLTRGHVNVNVLAWLRGIWVGRVGVVEHVHEHAVAA